MVRDVLRRAARLIWRGGAEPCVSTPDERDRALATAILGRAEDLRGKSDRELAETRVSLSLAASRMSAGRHDDMAIQLFPLVYEATRRRLGVSLYEVQLLAGLALARGRIAEMLTGEGKTFTSLLPAARFALTGGGVHVMTVNSYLARRDSELLTPVLQSLGFSVGLIDAEVSADEKREAYACDVTFGPGYEFGFDYLRDQMARVARKPSRPGELLRARRRGIEGSAPLSMQRGLAAAIVDEADSVMLDEATTPLILAVGGKEVVRDATPYLEARQVSRALIAGTHFLVDRSSNSLELTRAGQEEIARTSDGRVRKELTRPWVSYIESALRADYLYHRDVHYVVVEGEVRIVDQYTGRVFHDRSWRDGLHQAVQAKEGVAITVELRSVARVTRQRFLLRYPVLCGMTGTATGAEAELKAIYGRDVTVIPPHRTGCRNVLPCRVFSRRDDKLLAIARDVRRRHELGQPTLIGTSSINSSRELALLLSQLGLTPQVLNGTQDTTEAEIVALAGQRAAVTVATNMAGRGTDIKLMPGVAELGGLHVIVTEPQESSRVDRQLIGRGARQGDPGSSQLFASADDSLFERHAPDLGRKIRTLADADGGEIIRTAELEAAILKLQSQLELRWADQRREMFASDDWLEKVLEKLA